MFHSTSAFAICAMCNLLTDSALIAVFHSLSAFTAINPCRVRRRYFRSNRTVSIVFGDSSMQLADRSNGVMPTTDL